MKNYALLFPFLLGVESQSLEQFTPDKADWSTFQSKAVDDNEQNTDHSPDGVGWIEQDQWLPWDGTIYDPSNYSKQAFASLICPGNTVRGIYELFYEHQPFANPKNPTKAEVDNWHAIALNHVRAMVGYTEPEYQVKPDKCLHLRALWSDERFRTRKWDTAEYPGTCEGSTNPHCGASFIPSKDDQQEYLPDGIEYCGSTAGSEGLFSAAKSNIPWSIKWIRPFCSTLGVEGFWGGHTGPWFHRPEFGWSWYDFDQDNQNSNAGLRAKWSGSLAPSKYENPDITNGKLTVNVEDVNPNPRFPGYECNGIKWFNTTASSATECYNRVMDDDSCGKRFMTYNGGDDGCGCYKPDMAVCEILHRAQRLTWDFEPIISSFDGLFIDTNKELSGNTLPYNGKRCPDIIWKTRAGDASHCLQKIIEGDYNDCGRKFITFNSANGGCACYPPERETCTSSETVRESGRQTYELEVDPSYNPPSDPIPSPSPTNSPTSVPTSAPTVPPTTSPTSAPTVPPTSAPTVPPTSAPNTSPTNDLCLEAWPDQFFFRRKPGKEVFRNCRFLALKSADKIAKICGKTASSTSGIPPAKDVCRVTCGTCPSSSCGEIVDLKFFHEKNPDNGKSHYRSCKWLREQPTERINYDCNTTTPSFDIEHPPAWERCPVTCGTCPRVLFLQN